MNNFLQIMAMDEDLSRRVVLVRAQHEAGINVVYDQSADQEKFQVFIHGTLPYREIAAWEFDSFSAARSFAAQEFKTDWEMLVWEGKIKRPCEEGGHECGSNSGGCSSGGGCSTGGCATDGASGGGCSTGSCHID